MWNFEDMSDTEIVDYVVEYFHVWYGFDGIDGVTDWKNWFNGKAPDNDNTRYEIVENEAGKENAKKVLERLTKNFRA